MSEKHAVLERLIGLVVLIGAVIAFADVTLEYTYPQEWRYDIASRLATWALLIAATLWTVLMYRRQLIRRSEMHRHE